jgi:protein-arginine kinase
MYRRTTERKSFLFFLTEEETEKILADCKYTLKKYKKACKELEGSPLWKRETAVEEHVIKSELVQEHIAELEKEGYKIVQDRVERDDLEVTVHKDGTTHISIKGEKKKEEEATYER